MAASMVVLMAGLLVEQKVELWGDKMVAKMVWMKVGLTVVVLVFHLADKMVR
jgi:hypothetical protein